MANNGTSNRIYINNANLSVQSGMKISPIEGEDLEVLPPSPVTDKGDISPVIDIYKNPYRDFTFDKISVPDYGYSNNISRITGIPANNPDFIADHHYISLMRCIDYMLIHRYKGKIIGNYDTPGANKK